MADQKLIRAGKNGKKLEPTLDAGTKSPWESPIDVVITWVNYSDANYCQTVLNRAPTCTGDFIELKYLLRSYLKFGFLDHIRHIYIVHSELHPPPSYLKQDHPRLRFVKHAELVRRSAYLPLTTREAITAHLHHIPDLSEWFLFSADDVMAMRPWEMLQRFLWEQGRCVIHTEDRRITPNLAQEDCSYVGWLRGAVESAQLLEQRFGKRRRNLDSHLPHLLNKPLLFELEALWPEHFDRTRSSSHQGHVSVEVLHDEFLVDTDRAVGYFVRDRRSDGLAYGRDVHTNGESLRPPVTPAKAALLKRYLTLCERTGIFANVQGPGVSDEYKAEPRYHDIVYGWLERLFPQPSDFEA